MSDRHSVVLRDRVRLCVLDISLFLSFSHARTRTHTLTLSDTMLNSEEGDTCRSRGHVGGM
jgi:hypothetical protein